MTITEMFWVGVCGLLALAVFTAAIHETWVRLRPPPVIQLSLVDRMIQATAIRCSEAEAHAVIRACRQPKVLADEVARIGYDSDSQLTDAQLHRLFMMCVHRTLTRVGESAYRSESRVLN